MSSSSVKWKTRLMRLRVALSNTSQTKYKDLASQLDTRTLLVVPSFLPMT